MNVPLVVKTYKNDFLVFEWTKNTQGCCKKFCHPEKNNNTENGALQIQILHAVDLLKAFIYASTLSAGFKWFVENRSSQVR